MFERGAVLELLARGGAVAVLLAIAISVARGPRTPSRLTGVLFCLGASGHALMQNRLVAGSLGPVIVPAWLLSAAAGGLFWAFALELFGDSKRLKVARFAPAAVVLGVSVLAVTSHGKWACSLLLVQNLLNAALMLHVLAVVGAGLRNDLVEPRRRLRGPMMLAVAIYALAVSGVQTAELFSGPATELSALAALLLLLLSIAGSIVFIRADERLFGPCAAPEPVGRTDNVPLQDHATLERLRHALSRDEVWRREGLTVGDLAELVGAPEYRLRKIINEGLRYRNFSALLNERRIEAAKAALRDPERGRTPISAIAFEVGFSSLAPFNRAFREATGQTPTVWRQAALAAASKSNKADRN